MFDKDNIGITYGKRSRLHVYMSIGGAAAAVVIALFVLFYPPMPGVADQGDFERVMTAAGLGEVNLRGESAGYYWFKYVTTEYKLEKLNMARLIGIIPTTSMIYPITAARAVSKLTGNMYFNTRFLAVVYAAIYILGLYLCLKWLRFKRKSTAVFFTAASLLVLMDGGYLIWFNSLYGEAMMITGLLFFIGIVVYAVKNLEEMKPRGILLLFIAAFLFLGAKMQCFVALPFMLMYTVRIALLKRKNFRPVKLKEPLAACILALVFYVGGIYVQINSTCGVDTEYNSVFYGILKNSPNPERDLAVLGLSTDMAVEAGKHAYLPKEQYVKYAPWSDLTKSEFNNKVSNLKLLRFYLLQPVRLMRGMEYTASNAFDTKGSLGKFEKWAVKEYTPSFRRFTLWSDFRNTRLPKTLFFLIPFYVLVLLVSVLEYIRSSGDLQARLRIELLWLIAIIGLLQFPLPYIGNGEADTAKQLFLFNYTFDILFLVVCTWIFDRAGRIFHKKVSPSWRW
jgi:hypothetical protein